MSAPPRPPARRKRPGRLWLFFWGRKRRGFPGLFVGVLCVVAVLAVLYAGVPGGEAVSRFLFLFSLLALMLLLLAAIVVAVLVACGVIRPRDRRRR
ncbi:MAG: hypothetical protein WAM30_07015 [Candidatus Dormiibacterota bacterium]